MEPGASLLTYTVDKWKKWFWSPRPVSHRHLYEPSNRPTTQLTDRLRRLLTIFNTINPLIQHHLSISTPFSPPLIFTSWGSTSSPGWRNVWPFKTFHLPVLEGLTFRNDPGSYTEANWSEGRTRWGNKGPADSCDDEYQGLMWSYLHLMHPMAVSYQIVKLNRWVCGINIS